MTGSPFLFIQQYLVDVVDFFKEMFSIFPPVIVSFLFFCPALWFVFEIIHYMRDSFKG